MRRHLGREPWLDAAPLTEREQLAYTHILRERMMTSKQVAACSGEKGVNAPHGATRSGAAGRLEKIGGRKDAYYRPFGNLDDDDLPTPPRRQGT